MESSITQPCLRTDSVHFGAMSLYPSLNYASANCPNQLHGNIINDGGGVGKGLQRMRRGCAESGLKIESKDRHQT